MGNNAGKWDSFYSKLDPKNPEHYIDTDTYTLGKEWLDECDVVEDWGCGKGWFGFVRGNKTTIGIDGSITPFADKVVDLEDYISDVEGIHMRAVAEHNYEWKKILQNLLDSFSKRAFVSFYTPMSDDMEAHLIYHSPGYDNIPELKIPYQVWEDMIRDSHVKFEKDKIPSKTVYGEETYYKLER